MVNGPCLMAPGSWLMPERLAAQSSWPRKNWRAGPGPGGPHAGHETCAHEARALKHEACALSHEPLTMNNPLINALCDYLS